MPTDWCPFCPGSGRVPEHYDVLIYPNDFPAFTVPAAEPTVVGDDFYKVRPSYGKCDVVLYHPHHHTSLPQLTVSHITLLVQLWRRRFQELASIRGIRYVLIFENKGAVIGVTMPHPHGQIYALPLIPPRVAQEMAAARTYRRRHRRCVFCDVLRRERKEARRVVAENDHFTAFVPFYARWPYEVHIYSRRHLGTLAEFRAAEENSLAEMLKWIAMKYDNLFQMSFPYMMLLHQASVGAQRPEFHFHIEFYPPHRSKDKLKYLASVETGGGLFLNDSLAEDKAEELRKVPPQRREEVGKA